MASSADSRPADRRTPIEPFSNDEYAAARSVALRLGQIFASVPTDTFRRLVMTAERARSIGPVLDPTLARDAGPELDDELVLFRTLRDARLTLDRLTEARS